MTSRSISRNNELPVVDVFDQTFGDMSLPTIHVAAWEDRPMVTPCAQVPFIDLPSFLRFQNPNLSRYQELSEELAQDQLKRGPPPQDEHAARWSGLLSSGISKTSAPILQDIFSSGLKGQNLIDLAGGKVSSIEDLANRFGVATWINVDRYIFKKRPLDSFINLAEFYGDIPPQPSPLQRVVVKDDMLCFLARIPSESCHVTINGVDHIVLDNPQYSAALAQEITRVTPLGGLVFGAKADVLAQLSPQIFRSIFLADDDRMACEILRKVRV